MHFHHYHHRGLEKQLQQLTDSMRRRHRTARRAARKASDLEDDLGAFALALLSLISALVEKGVLTEEEIFDHLNRVDQADGVADGQTSTEVLRDTLGLERQPTEPEAPTPTRKRRR